MPACVGSAQIAKFIFFFFHPGPQLCLGLGPEATETHSCQILPRDETERDACVCMRVCVRACRCVCVCVWGYALGDLLFFLIPGGKIHPKFFLVSFLLYIFILMAIVQKVV